MWDQIVANLTSVFLDWGFVPHINQKYNLFIKCVLIFLFGSHLTQLSEPCEHWVKM